MRTIRHRHRRETYSLANWRIAESAEGLMIEGHLHGRFGFPEGVMIGTSDIESFRILPNGIVFRTANSTYFGRLSDYCLSSRSLRFLDDEAAEHLEGRVKELRNEHYAPILEKKEIENARILSICCCEYSYIRWVAEISSGEVKTFDPGYETFESRFELSFGNDNTCDVRRISDLHSALHLDSSAASEIPVYVENAGTCPMTISVTETGQDLTIAPGEIRLVERSHRPLRIAV